MWPVQTGNCLVLWYTWWPCMHCKIPTCMKAACNLPGHSPVQAKLYPRLLAAMKPGATLGLSHGLLAGRLAERRRGIPEGHQCGAGRAQGDAVAHIQAALEVICMFDMRKMWLLSRHRHFAEKWSCLCRAWARRSGDCISRASLSMVLASMHPLRCTRWGILPSLLLLFCTATGRFTMHLGQGSLLCFLTASPAVALTSLLLLAGCDRQCG